MFLLCIPSSPALLPQANSVYMLHLIPRIEFVVLPCCASKLDLMIPYLSPNSFLGRKILLGLLYQHSICEILSTRTAPSVWQPNEIRVVSLRYISEYLLTWQLDLDSASQPLGSHFHVSKRQTMTFPISKFWTASAKEILEVLLKSWWNCNLKLCSLYPI